ncbi:hypothetical protein JCGZ_11764 [Jatropha curcas]|uniref:Uncharacterized protein n=1 Tax=Jatropha curcas TaxID=180498 RepID=A0A067K8P9_JATCU|nr:protein MICROTUBULE BINDING PROTEIN 2C [Jatropha curcas]KDP31388.1 hypothetical protein JCGZ_11764 [Jatropha curcas]
MYDPQHFVDLQENSNFGDPKSWLSGDDNSSPTLRRTHSQLSVHTSTSTSTTGAAGNVDRVLFNNLVEMVPLVESLIVIDRKTSSSFTRRGSMIYTKTPSRESLHKKMIDPKGRNTTQSIPARKKKEHGDKDQGKNAGNNQDADSFSIFSSRALSMEKDVEELSTLREQVEDLQRKLFEKDELLKSAEISKNQMNVVNVKLDELKQLAAEKDSLIKATQTQLSDAKIKLADKQAALEKIQWEAMTSNRKVEKLQEELDSVQGGISSLMMLFEGLTNNGSTTDAEDYDVKPCYLDYLPDIDDLDDMDMQKMEEARQAYLVAVATAKEKQDEESVAAAARARIHLQSFVFRSNNLNAGKDFSNGGISRGSYGAFLHKVQHAVD